MDGYEKTLLVILLVNIKPYWPFFVVVVVFFIKKNTILLIQKIYQWMAFSDSPFFVAVQVKEWGLVPHVIPKISVQDK